MVGSHLLLIYVYFRSISIFPPYLQPKLVKALVGHRVVQVACGSRDAQTIALTDNSMVFSWGDGDFGKLGQYRL